MLKIGDIVRLKHGTIPHGTYFYGYVATKPFKEKDRTSHICRIHWFESDNEVWEYVKDLVKVA